jgi:hypothetical protein
MGEWVYRSTFSWPRHKLEVTGQLHASSAFLKGKEPPVPIGWEVGWTPRASLDDLEKRKNSPPPRLELRPLGRARSQSLYRLCYPGSRKDSMQRIFIKKRLRWEVFVAKSGSQLGREILSRTFEKSQMMKRRRGSGWDKSQKTVGFDALVKRWYKYINVSGRYVEK